MTRRSVAVLGLLLAVGACHGEVPSNLGLHNGRFADCPSTDNCVSSQATDDHQVEPLVARAADCPSTMAKVATIIEAEPRTVFVARNPAYVRAEFTSRVFQFVDDVEVVCDPATHRVDIRSASRLGQGDLGVNRARVKRLKAALNGS